MTGDGQKGKMKNTIYDIALSYADKQEHIVDPLQREAPLFQNLPCMETSKMDKNIFEIVKDVAIPTVNDFDAPLPKLYANTELNYASLAKIGGRIELPLDKCRMLGRAELIQKQMPVILNRAGQAFDASFMYNSLRKFCIDHASDCVTNAGGGDSGGYSIVGITWGEGENYGLFKPALSGQKMFDVYPLSGGNIMNIQDKEGKEISGYVIEMVMFLGIQLARLDRIHSIINIDATHLPTFNDLLDMVYSIGGYGDNSVFFAHPKLIYKLRSQYMADNQHKDGFVMDADGNLRVDKVRFIADPNMLDGTETKITL